MLSYRREGSAAMYTHVHLVRLCVAGKARGLALGVELARWSSYPRADRSKRAPHGPRASDAATNAHLLARL